MTVQDLAIVIRELFMILLLGFFEEVPFVLTTLSQDLFLLEFVALLRVLLAHVAAEGCSFFVDDTTVWAFEVFLGLSVLVTTNDSFLLGWSLLFINGFRHFSIINFLILNFGLVDILFNDILFEYEGVF